ncbi:MAG: GtrA family protein [Actinomycetia bacterium]|nr:GtrA family protein [Actinomycetes bacterium]
MSFIAGLNRRFAHLKRELAKFGSVGAIAFVITFGIFNALHQSAGVGPISSNVIATVVATTFAYFANRYWTFRHRDRTGLGREYLLFFVLNGIGLVISSLFVGFTTYVLDLEGVIPSNAALIVGTGVATLFRFWSYKKWVFLPTTVPVVDPHTGMPAGAEVPSPVGDGRSTRPSTPHRANSHVVGPRPVTDDHAEFRRVTQSR